MHDYISAAILGVIEGITEFLPVSSTGHLIVFMQWLGFKSEGDVFEVFIQLGAILAVVVLYWGKIWSTLVGLTRGDKVARKFTVNIIAATIPVLIAGAALHGFMKEHLYKPTIIGSALVAGGIIFILIEQRLKKVKVESIDDIPVKMAFLIGCFQCFALIPGVSRSGATIMGALLLGLARPAAAEFSFFVAIPVMCAAVGFDTLHNLAAIRHSGQWGLMWTGFVVAFLVAMPTLHYAMQFIRSKGFAPFGWYRIVFGIIVLAYFSSHAMIAAG